ncbi:hypothetical protein [uncultured Muribaculum sp.]|uniref:hypothetical protein n=1 Tax=uncultured Muribaculum sp. TaxID=1918613 RepID=UPI002591DE18|nr:hypothetical protein [uncultured Muribaculum sp.]
MILKHIPVLLTSAMLLFSCSSNDDPKSGGETEEHVYSLTAVLDNVKSRISYQEDPESHDLKMTWDEGDVIRLYPDASMNDPEPYYDFIANTGAGTSHTVFVHQGYILNWEHWSGKAIYVFPGGDNLEVDVDSKEFLSKAYVQKSNGNTEHLKYAEHELGEDGSKRYTEYWSQFLKDANLKHDHQLTFSHPHTVVYKVMLRGFIFDIPGGSELRMSGDAWGREVTKLTLGSKDDTEPFVKVGEYGKDGYEDNVLTAYIIRQIAGDVDGEIKNGEKLKFELLTYDELDGTVMPLDPEDTMRNDNPDYGPDYLTNLPWGDEYTWNVTATADIEYKAGDYVVADLTNTSRDYAYPKVAVDLGLPLKWGAFNIGAKKIDDPGEYAVWGKNTLYTSGGSNLPQVYGGEWTSGDPEHDAASSNWGNEWRTPTFNEFLDLAHYAEWLDSNDSEANRAGARWDFELDANDRIYYFKTNPARDINGVKVALVKSKTNGKYVYLHIAGNLQSSVGVQASTRAFYNTSSSKNNGTVVTMYCIREDRNGYYLGLSDNKSSGGVTIKQLAASVRAVKRQTGAY